jgi:UrcA family protein
MKTSLLSLAAVTLLAIPGAASAEDALRVQFGDLNLADRNGAAAFDARVAEAARDICRRGGPRLVDTRCIQYVQREAARLLPLSRQDDYALARRVDEGLNIRTPNDPA